MHLALFPELLAFPMVATLFVRLVVAWFFLTYGTAAFRAHHALTRVVGLLWLATGGLLLAGLYTQGAALVAILLCSLAALHVPGARVGPPDRRTYVLLSVLAATLLFYGGGIFSLDLPL